MVKILQVTKKHWLSFLLITITSGSSALALRASGILQMPELKLFDTIISLKPAEPVDNRFVIVGISDEDLNWLGTPVLNDQAMAELISRVKQQSPRLIGLDFYRNLPIEPGSQALQRVFQSTPNLIGIEKVVEATTTKLLPGNPILAEADQLAASDIVVDRDGWVRRGLLFPSTTTDYPLEGLGFRIALDYLALEGITPDTSSKLTLKLGDARINQLTQHAGGYVNVDTGGYQILLNSRRSSQEIQTVSLKEVLSDQVSPELMRDRIVMIGSVATSNADVFYTGINNSHTSSAHHTYGIEVHTELASQLISAALDNRPLIQTLPEWLEILTVVAFACLGIRLQVQQRAEWQRALLTVTAGGICVGIAAGSLITVGLWIPAIPPLASLVLSSMAMGFSRTQQLKVLSTKDRLTGLANRYLFDETLQREWFRALRYEQSLSLIICDIDYFKHYNDTYGHVQGDQCLRSVATVIGGSVQRSSDLVARYGGEEFVVLLPNTNPDDAMKIAKKIRERVKAINLPHQASQVSDRVTLSLGVSGLVPTMKASMTSLVEQADLGLYEAKKTGRDRTFLKVM